MERGFLQWSFKTVCSNAATQSKPVNGSVSFPEVVKYVDCYIYSDTQAYCNWKTIIDTPDLQFFYQLKDQSKTEGSIWSPLLECSSYNFTDSQNPGCHLQANFLNDVYILFNGTLNETLFRNTFKRLLEARPPALTVLVTKSGTKLNISWTHPAVSVLDWKFTIKYNECKEEKSITVNERTSHMLELVPHCPYHIAVQAKHDRGKTPWSEWTHFGPEEGANTWLYAAIIIPLTAALLAVLAFVCWSRNKDKIFPKIPKPVDLISDISENNNKDTVCRLYVQAEEEENCKIALVIDP
ncbi:interleukin-13 receptor subunit alpha-1 isoform 2-T2 [Pholidichthys leucotaenia]